MQNKLKTVKMNLTSYAVRFLLLTMIVISVSCQKEIEGEVTPDPTPSTPVPPAPAPAKTCINCEYLPVCDSSVYVYVDSTAGGIDSNRNVVNILKDTIVSGIKYSGVTTLGLFDNGVFYNCEAQDYKVLFNASDLGINVDSLFGLLFQGLPVSPGTLPKPGILKATILKANAAPGTKWKDVLYAVNLVVLNIEVAMESELVAKFPTRSVLSKSYSDVIQVKSNIRVAAGLAGNTNLSELVIYYAKGVGIIEARVSDDQGLQLVRKLFSRRTF